jgi:hypothetical protein
MMTRDIATDQLDRFVEHLRAALSTLGAISAGPEGTRAHVSAPSTEVLEDLTNRGGACVDSDSATF